MNIRTWAIAFGLGVCLLNSLDATIGQAQSALPIVQPSVTQTQGAVSDAELSVESTLRFHPRWPLLTAFFLGIGAIAVGTQQYRARCRWRRVDYARKVVEEFKRRPGVQNVMSILDFEEYRSQYYTDPLTGEIKYFEATDARLRRSLREHDAMVKIKAALGAANYANGLIYQEPMGDRRYIDAETCKQYETLEFPVEVQIRNWFDEFLHGLEDIEAMIRGGLFTAGDVKPFIIYWIQVIADRTVRRKGGASFYDPLFYYIHHSGYTGVESLFERFGYKVLPPPYTKKDFEKDAEVEQLSFGSAESDTFRALCCAKASMLVYEDEKYIRDIVKLWLRDDEDSNYRQQTNEEFLASIVHEWQNERNAQSIDLHQYFKSFEDRETDTQAFVFRTQNHIILVFRGTEKFQDWQTNLSLSLRDFQDPLYSEMVEPAIPPVGRVHRGFLNALKSVEADIVEVLDAWGARLPIGPQLDNDDSVEPPKLWITGHSLGGALAALAAVSLKYQQFNVAGLYTFGQPRVGDWSFIGTAMKLLNHPTPIYIERYANNNDIVPLIPPGFVPWQPTRVYGHFGQFRYFNSQGELKLKTLLGQRFPDRLRGFLSAMVTSGPDAVSDHFMEFYIANLQKAIEHEKEAVKMEEKKEERQSKKQAMQPLQKSHSGQGVSEQTRPNSIEVHH